MPWGQVDAVENSLNLCDWKLKWVGGKAKDLLVCWWVLRWMLSLVQCPRYTSFFPMLFSYPYPHEYGPFICPFIYYCKDFPELMPYLSKFYPLIKILNNFTMASSLELALENLSIQDRPNMRGSAKYFRVHENTLRRRWKGQTLSRRAATSLHRRKLTDAQEESLIGQNNTLIERGIPPTSRTVRNFAEGIIKGSVGKNWTSDFVKRHSARLKSLYLTNRNSKREKSEYAAFYKQYYDLVSNDPLISFISYNLIR